MAASLINSVFELAPLSRDIDQGSNETHIHIYTEPMGSSLCFVVPFQSFLTRLLIAIGPTLWPYPIPFPAP